ncbi:hypothetical protein DFH08DRAFT_799619 [Mycena albidolilacea]|uniref:Uncharacterized protein n=1 Tax=Mycena albidolilacea TaxID=1033008 RepID=A0AAD7F2L7_9AGAR|nr:hypothetical protein DFH08DRAFT_799619 [Mycena albidolilacea]
MQFKIPSLTLALVALATQVTALALEERQTNCCIPPPYECILHPTQPSLACCPPYQCRPVVSGPDGQFVGVCPLIFLSSREEACLPFVLSAEVPPVIRNPSRGSQNGEEKGGVRLHTNGIQTYSPNLDGDRPTPSGSVEGKAHGFVIVKFGFEP